MDSKVLESLIITNESLNMNDSTFYKIYNIIKPILPLRVSETIFYSSYDNLTKSMQTVCYITINGKALAFYTYLLKDSNKDENDENLYFKALDRISNIILQEYNKLDSKNKWKSMTLVFDSKGNHKCNFRH